MKLKRSLRCVYYFIIRRIIKTLEKVLRNKIVSVKKIHILCLPEVFPPVFTISTELMLDILARIVKPGMDILEVGSGSGVISIFIAKKGANVLATDISEKAIIATKLNAKINNVSVRVVKSDLFENVCGKFDLIIFNPPYIPLEPRDIFDMAIFCGCDYRTIIRFLSSARKYLKRNGFVLICLSSIIDESKILTFAKRYYIVNRIASRRILFERISVYKLIPKS